MTAMNIGLTRESGREATISKYLLGDFPETRPRRADVVYADS